MINRNKLKTGQYFTMYWNGSISSIWFH